MKKFKNKITLINIVSSLILQLCLLISGLIIPRLILSYFGSTTNGLVSSINQFLNFVVLIDGGLGSVVVAALYKPLYENDQQKISSILKTSQKMYRRIGIGFSIYTIILAVVYPLIFATDFSFLHVFSLTIILSLTLLIQYMFCISSRLLLNADKKIYIVSFLQTTIVILNCIFSYLSLKIYPSIHILKLVSVFLYLVQPFVYNYFTKKYYQTTKDAPEDKSIIKNRWNGFAINFAAFIHTSTDIAILTIFTNLTCVSIYSVYALVTTGLRSIIITTVGAMNPNLGNAYVSNSQEQLNQKMNIYEFVLFGLTFVTFSVAMLLITPFVMIYTSGISDANYYQPVFGILILTSTLIDLIKLSHLNLAFSANKFKGTTAPAFIEAGINIVLSIILVIFFGLIGVVIATIVAMTYRLIFHAFFTKTIIKDRSVTKFFLKILVCTITMIIGILICNLVIPKVEYTILSWIWHGFAYLAIIGVLFTITFLFIFKNEMKHLVKYIKSK